MKFKSVPPQVHRAMREVFKVDDLTTFEIARVLAHVGLLLEHGFEAHSREEKLSVARVRLLTWLLVSERAGQPPKVSPTMLSHFHNVSRNTISALLSGLEEQGLIERAVDPEDRRRFHIKLTGAGREIALEQAPAAAEHVARLVECLTPEEQKTLLHLLEKLRDALIQTHCGEMPKENDESRASFS
jgi:DNA-binding MarR family transcriptional regulator